MSMTLGDDQLIRAWDAHEEAAFTALLDDIYNLHNHDFRGYSGAFLRRRLSLAMSRLEIGSVDQLRARINSDPRVFSTVFQHLTVSVSEMFRDPQYFRSLRDDVLPILKTYSSPRIWVAGCGAGEEVYSIAILLQEMGMLECSLIYATDINPLALRTASLGIFPVANLPAYTLNYRAAGGEATLADYYHVAYGTAVFDRQLRRRIVFAEHSLATDAIFSEMQFVSCRNVLIYFNREMQGRTINMFADTLCHRGFLGLGAREGIAVTGAAARFESFVKPVKIYRKTPEFY